MPRGSTGGLEVKPVTPGRWDDLVELFGPRGAVGGCWCMYWRQPRDEWRAHTNEGNRRRMKRLVSGRRVPGLLAYRDGKPVGWVSIAHRDEFNRLNASRTLARVDDRAVWAIVCFYIHRRERGAGVGTALLRAAVDQARKRGATIVEAYPVDPTSGRTDNASAYTGVLKMYRDAGFEEVERRAATRPIVRKRISRRRARKGSARSSPSGGSDARSAPRRRSARPGTRR